MTMVISTLTKANVLLEQAVGLLMKENDICAAKDMDAAAAALKDARNALIRTDGMLEEREVRRLAREKVNK